MARSMLELHEYFLATGEQCTIGHHQVFHDGGIGGDAKEMLIAQLNGIQSSALLSPISKGESK